MGKKKKRIDKRIVAGALGVLLIVASVGAGIVLVQRTQILEEEAVEPSGAPISTQIPLQELSETGPSTFSLPLGSVADCTNPSSDRCGPGDQYGQVFGGTDCSGDPNDQLRFCCGSIDSVQVDGQGNHLQIQGDVDVTYLNEFHYCRFPKVNETAGSNGPSYCSTTESRDVAKGYIEYGQSSSGYFPIMPDPGHSNSYDANSGEPLTLKGKIVNISDGELTGLRAAFHAQRVTKLAGEDVDENTSEVTVVGSGGQTAGLTEGIAMRNHFMDGSIQEQVYFTPWLDIETILPGQTYTVEQVWTAGEANQGGFSSPACGIYQIDLLVEDFGPDGNPHPECLEPDYNINAGFIRVTGCEEEPPAPGQCNDTCTSNDDCADGLICYENEEDPTIKNCRNPQCERALNCICDNPDNFAQCSGVAGAILDDTVTSTTRLGFNASFEADGVDITRQEVCFHGDCESGTAGCPAGRESWACLRDISPQDFSYPSPETDNINSDFSVPTSGADEGIFYYDDIKEALIEKGHSASVIDSQGIKYSVNVHAAVGSAEPEICYGNGSPGSNLSFGCTPHSSCLGSFTYSSDTVAQCTDVKAYTVTGDPGVIGNWKLLSASDLSQLSAGDEVYLTVTGSVASAGAYTKARFTINGTTRPEVTNTKPPAIGIEQTIEFYDAYTLPGGVTGFQIIGEVFHTELGWL